MSDAFADTNAKKTVGKGPTERVTKKKTPGVMKKPKNVLKKKSGGEGKTEVKEKKTPSPLKSKKQGGLSGQEKEEILQQLNDLQIALDKAKHEKDSLKTVVANEREAKTYLETEKQRVERSWELSKKDLEAKQKSVENAQTVAQKAETKHLQDVLELNKKIRMALLRVELSKRSVEAQTDAPPDPQHLNTTQGQDNQENEDDGAVTVSVVSRRVQTDYVDLPSADIEIKKERRDDHEEEHGEEDEEEGRQDFQNIVENIRKQHENELAMLKEEKAKQFEKILQNHQKDLLELRQEYQSLLKSEREKLQHEQEKGSEIHTYQEKLMGDLESCKENYDKLFELYKGGEQKISELEKENEKLKLEIGNSKGTLSDIKTMERDNSKLQKQYNILWSGFKKLERERNDLYQEFTSAVQMLRTQTELKNETVEKQLRRAQQILSANQAVFSA